MRHKIALNRPEILLHLRVESNKIAKKIFKESRALCHDTCKAYK